jgi:nicotinamidase-related amidase
LRESNNETVTLIGYMTKNCVNGTAAGAEPLGFAVEVLSNATGAIHLTNSSGSIPAEQVHQTLMTLLNSNFAAVATTDQWLAAVEENDVLAGSNLISSATDGRTAHG